MADNVGVYSTVVSAHEIDGITYQIVKIDDDSVAQLVSEVVAALQPTLREVYNEGFKDGLDA